MHRKSTAPDHRPTAYVSTRLLSVLSVALFALFATQPAKAADPAPVDPAVVGTWRIVLPGKQAPTLIAWTINADGQYKMAFHGPDNKPDDTGKIHLAAQRWGALSDTGRATQGTYQLRDSSTLAVTLGAGRPALWMRLADTPATQPVATPATDAPVDPAIVGTWRSEMPAGNAILMIAWKINADGTYLLDYQGPGNQPDETGKLHFSEGAWNSKSDAGKSSKGTYTLTDHDTLSTTLANTQPVIWLRSDSVIIKPKPAPLAIATPPARPTPTPPRRRVVAEHVPQPSTQPYLQTPTTLQPSTVPPTPTAIAKVPTPTPAQTPPPAPSTEWAHQPPTLNASVPSAPLTYNPELGTPRPADNPAGKMVVEIETLGDARYLLPDYYVLSPDRAHISYANGNGGFILDGKKFPLQGEIQFPQFTADSNHTYAYVRNGKTEAFMVDGNVGPYVKGFASHFALSPDGKHLAYCGTDDKNLTFVTDTGPIDAVFTQVGNPVFSPDSQHLAIAGMQGKQGIVIYDGKQVAQHDSIERANNPNQIHESPFVFSPDSQHYAYVATDGRARYVFYDNKPGPLANNSTWPQFSANAKHFGYLINSPVPHAVIDNIEQPAYPAVTDFSFSPDGSHYAYIAHQKKNAVVVLDGNPGKPYSQIAFPPRNYPVPALRWSADGSTLAYPATDGKRKLLVVNDQESDIIGQLYEMKLSDDGKHMAYQANAKGLNFIVLDGVQGEPVTEIGKPDFFFIPHSNRLIYGARSFDPKTNIQLHWIVDGTTSGVKTDDMPRDVITSPDGSHLAYSLTTRSVKNTPTGTSFIIDGKPGPQYAGIAYPSFSPDSKHWAYQASSFATDGSTSLQGVAVDDYLCPQFDLPLILLSYAQPMYPLQFDNANQLHFFATKDRQLLRITYRPLRPGEATPPPPAPPAPLIAEVDAPDPQPDDGPPKLPTLDPAPPSTQTPDQPVDPAVVGAWRTSADGDVALAWTIHANGHYQTSMQNMDADRAGETGLLHFRQGKWDTSADLNRREDHGTYTLIDNTTLSTTNNGKTTIWFRCKHNIPTSTSVTAYRMAHATPGGLDPATVGTWRYQNTLPEGIEIVTVVIHPDGKFRRGYSGASKKPDETGQILFANDSWKCTLDGSNAQSHGTYDLRDPDGLAVYIPDPRDANRAPPPPGFLPGVQANHDATQMWLRYQPAPPPPK